MHVAVSAVQRNLLHSAQVAAGMNAGGFLATMAFKTHKITDLVGTGAFVVAASKFSAQVLAMKSDWSLAALASNRVFWIDLGVTIWGVRLASFLFKRVLQLGKDDRLEQFFPCEGEGWLDKERSLFPLKLLGFWFLQATWMFVTMLPVSIVNALAAFPSASLTHAPSGGQAAFSILGLAALATMFAGIAVEALADHQKYQHVRSRSSPRWCSQGLWAYSRHPNYFGEMLTWWSIFLAALPSIYSELPALYSGVALLSPVFISLLLWKVSGIALTEQKNSVKYAGNEEYAQYVKNTPMLIPWSVLKRKRD